MLELNQRGTSDIDVLRGSKRTMPTPLLQGIWRLHVGVSNVMMAPRTKYKHDSWFNSELASNLLHQPLFKLLISEDSRMVYVNIFQPLFTLDGIELTDRLEARVAALGRGAHDQFTGFDLLNIAEGLKCGVLHPIAAHSNDHNHNSWVCLVEDEDVETSPVDDYGKYDWDVPMQKLVEREFNYDHTVAYSQLLIKACNV